MDDCRFCQIAAGNADTELIAQSGHSVAFYDRYPVSDGHTLVIPRHHEADLFDVDPVERFNPDGLNIGINENEAAGQTIHHAHIHLIPRYQGDVEDPRGGIRWVIPDKAPYWG